MKSTFYSLQFFGLINQMKPNVSYPSNYKTAAENTRQTINYRFKTRWNGRKWLSHAIRIGRMQFSYRSPLNLIEVSLRGFSYIASVSFVLLQILPNSTPISATSWGNLYDCTSVKDNCLQSVYVANLNNDRRFYPYPRSSLYFRCNSKWCILSFVSRKDFTQELPLHLLLLRTRVRLTFSLYCMRVWIFFQIMSMRHIREIMRKQFVLFEQ